LLAFRAAVDNSAAAAVALAAAEVALLAAAVLVVVALAGPSTHMHAWKAWTHLIKHWYLGGLYKPTVKSCLLHARSVLAIASVLHLHLPSW